MPYSILSDNGAQFAGFKKGYTQFERWLMDLDILPLHAVSSIRKLRGKIERFHRTMKNELLNHQVIANIDHAQVQFRSWRDKYNHVRPHEALGMKCPGQVVFPQ